MPLREVFLSARSPHMPLREVFLSARSPHILSPTIRKGKNPFRVSTKDAFAFQSRTRTGPLFLLNESVRAVRCQRPLSFWHSPEKKKKAPSSLITRRRPCLHGDVYTPLSGRCQSLFLYFVKFPFPFQSCSSIHIVNNRPKLPSYLFSDAIAPFCSFRLNPHFPTGSSLGRNRPFLPLSAEPAFSDRINVSDGGASFWPSGTTSNNFFIFCLDIRVAWIIMLCIRTKAFIPMRGILPE